MEPHCQVIWETTHLPGHQNNISLTFYATDTLNASSLLNVQVQQCACHNSGNCTLLGAVISDPGNEL